MKRMSYLWRFAGVMGAMIILAGCAQQMAMRRLTPTEQQEFRAYSKIMTAKQTRTYLAQETPAARVAYLTKIGAMQRFQALSALDQTSVLNGFIRKGMSAEALHFLWGDPYYTEGRPGQFENWIYLGSSASLAETGNDSRSFGSQVQVLLVNGQVDTWMDFVPSTNDDAGDKGSCRGC
jgi:hypothetical protein